ncbi:MAG: hypothetical protein GC162_10390 [Planctomycetes bacterium]|nr:hypothetical protein [Planctomycetota bacterium]
MATPTHGASSIERFLSGSAIIESSAHALIGKDVSLSGSAIVTMASTAALGVPVWLSGSAIVTTTTHALANLDDLVSLSGSAIMSSIASATMVLDIHLASTLFLKGTDALVSASHAGIADVLKWVDFEPPAFGELAAGPAQSGTVTITQSATAAMPDRGAIGLLVSMTAGAGDGSVQHDLGSAQTILFTRIMFAPATLSGGAVTIVMGKGSDIVERWRITYTPSTRAIAVATSTGESLSATLVAGLDWHCIELEVNAITGALELWINGIRADSDTGISATLAARYVQIGAVTKATAATGDFYLDEWIMANRYIAPVRVFPIEDHAGDARRLLVVYNLDDAESIEWAQWYRDYHGVPYANLVGLALGTDEDVDATAAGNLRTAVAAYIADNYLAPFIKSILLGYGCPGTFDGSQSLQSCLADLSDATADLANPLYMAGVVDTDDLPDRSSLIAAGRYLVAEINAPTLVIAKAITTLGAGMVHTDAVDREFGVLDASIDRIAAAADDWSDLTAWLGTVSQQQARLPLDADYDGSSHGSAIEMTDADHGDFDTDGQTRALFVGVGNNGADEVAT